VRPIKYTDGSNGVVRLPEKLWVAFYEAAQYMEYDSVQECFIDYLDAGYSVDASLSFVDIVYALE